MSLKENLHSCFETDVCSILPQRKVPFNTEISAEKTILSKIFRESFGKKRNATFKSLKLYFHIF